jgi:hypothetical protein
MLVDLDSSRSLAYCVVQNVLLPAVAVVPIAARTPRLVVATVVSDGGFKIGEVESIGQRLMAIDRWASSGYVPMDYSIGGDESQRVRPTGARVEPTLMLKML